MSWLSDNLNSDFEERVDLLIKQQAQALEDGDVQLASEIEEQINDLYD